MESPFHVPPFLHVLGGLVQRHLSFWIWLGRLESRLLADELEPISVHTPIYISGLARSGSTLLHEVIASHPGVASTPDEGLPDAVHALLVVAPLRMLGVFAASARSSRRRPGQQRKCRRP